MNTIIYMRTSRSDSLLPQQNSISQQRKSCQQYCQKHGYKVVDEHFDIDTIPDYEKLKAFIETKNIDKIVVYSFERLFRSFDNETFMNFLNDRKVSVEYIKTEK